MKRNVLFAAVVVVALLAGLVIGAAMKGEKPKEPEMDPEMAKAMEMYAKLAAPGEPHEELARFDGEWDVVSKFWMAPGQEPMASTGASKNKMILGGRYSLQKYESTFMGKPFNGLGITGYDNVTKEYQSVWMDDMSTAIMFGTGKELEDGSVEIVMKYTDPMDGKDKAMRSVSRWLEDGSTVFEMFGPGPDGKEYKTMEMVYSQKK